MGWSLYNGSKTPIIPLADMRKLWFKICIAHYGKNEIPAATKSELCELLKLVGLEKPETVVTKKRKKTETKVGVVAKLLEIVRPSATLTDKVWEELPHTRCEHGGKDTVTLDHWMTFWLTQSPSEAVGQIVFFFQSVSLLGKNMINETLAVQF
eukprot:SAG11_NODE_223_length_12120_cov_6.351884_6_plen_153_part_00